MTKRRILELIGLAMIGEGLIVAMRPRRYMALWDCGPKWLRGLVGSWARHPETTRMVGIVELLAGAALALRQTDAQPGALL
jgi:hypothetical protein